MGNKQQPGRYDCFARAEPDEPIFVLLGRDADAARAVLAWCRARLARISLGTRPLADLKQVAEATGILRAFASWRLNRAVSRPCDPVPTGVWRERIAELSRELQQLTEQLVEPGPAHAKPADTPVPRWCCAVEGTPVGVAATRFAAMRLAEHRIGDAVVREAATGEEWRRIDGAWKPAAQSTR